MVFGRKNRPAAISPTDVAPRVAAGEVALVDVRELNERQRLAPGVKSAHIPLGQLTERIAELPTDKPVAFVCAAGGRSSSAAKFAAGAGVDALNVTGGMTAWHAAGVATKRGR